MYVESDSWQHIHPGYIVTVPAATPTLKAGLGLADDLLPRCAWNRPMSKAHKGEMCYINYVTRDSWPQARGARARAYVRA